MEESDERLLARVRQNDRQAFSILVRRHSQRFFKMAWRMTGQTPDAEEIVQEAFLRLWEKPERWQPGKGAAFTTWFSRMIMNIAIDRSRRLKSSSRYLARAFTEDVQTAPGSVQFAAEQSALEKALQMLPARQRAAINLSFYEEMSNREAAAVLGINVKALESLLMRAKAALRAQLAREGLDV